LDIWEISAGQISGCVLQYLQVQNWGKTYRP
jgi:hypothetical protein